MSFRQSTRALRAVGVLTVIVGLFASVQVAAAQRASGVVASYADGVVTLADGTSFSVDPATRVVISTPATMEDLQPGRYVAITAARMDDGTLLASSINIQQSGDNQRQSPLSDGNIM